MWLWLCIGALFPSVPLSVASVGGGWTSLARCPPLSDPYPAHSKSVATSFSSSFYATNKGRSLGTVSVTGIQGYNATSTATYANPRPYCFAVVDNTTGATLRAVPAFAKYIVAGGRLAALGCPNYDQQSDYSFVDVVSVGVASASSPTAPPLLNVQTIEDHRTPNLGLSLALDPTGMQEDGRLAAYFDPGTVLVYSPAFNRSFSTWNNFADNDTEVLLPQYFWMDSIALHGPWLAVSGTQFFPNVSQCIPTVALYTYNQSTWTAADVVPLLRTSSLGSPENLLAPCPLRPANNFPVDISPDGQRIIVGVPQWSTVFVGTLANLSSSLTYISSTTFVGFAKLVGFPSADEIFVHSATGVYFFEVADFVAAAATPTNPIRATAERLYSFVVPNKLQRRHIGSHAPRPYVSSAGRPNMTVVLRDVDPSDPGSELFTLSVAPPGQQYDLFVNEWKLCPPGRFRSANDTSFLPCSLCPRGTYQSAHGATSCKPCPSDAYCPIGSTFPFSTQDVDVQVPAEGPTFESLSFREAFEDVLVSSVFNPTFPSMILLYAIASVTVLLALLSFAPCLRRSWLQRNARRVLGVYRFTQLPNHLAEEIHALERRLVVDADEHHSSFEHKRHQAARRYFALLTGFCSVIFFLFAVSSVAFSVAFLYNYDPDGPLEEHEGWLPNNMFATEDLKSSSIQNQGIQDGLQAQAISAITFRIDMVGYSGIVCSNSTPLATIADGCWIMNSPLPCNDTSHMVVEAHETLPNTCSFVMNIPENSVWASTTRLGVVLPPYLYVQALQFSLASPGSSPQPDDFTVAPLLFVDSVVYPLEVDSYLPAVVEREWQFVPLVSEVQDNAGSPPHFYRSYYDTYQSLSAQTFRHVSFREYLFEDEARSLTFAANIMSTGFIRLQSTEQLIQPKEAFLTFLLGVIAIYHVVHFATEVAEAVLFLYNRSFTLKHAVERRLQGGARPTSLPTDSRYQSVVDTRHGPTGDQHMGIDIPLSTIHHSKPPNPLYNGV